MKPSGPVFYTESHGANVWPRIIVWRSCGGYARPFIVSGWKAAPYRLARLCLYALRQCEKRLAAKARYGRDRHHVGEHEGIGADKPFAGACLHHVDQLGHGDDGASREAGRHRGAYSLLHDRVGR